MRTELTPEGSDLLVRYQNTTEGNEDYRSELIYAEVYSALTSNEEWIDERGKDSVRSVGSDELSDTSVEEFVKCHL